MNPIPFSFGKNWKSYLQTVGEIELEKAQQDILEWLTKDQILNRTVLDIGSGSGIHSYCFYRLGAGKMIFKNKALL